MQMMTRFEWLQAQSFNTRKGPQSYSPEIEAEIARLFPNIDPGVRPFGQRVLVQLRLAKARSAAGIEFVAETQDAQKWNEAVGQLLAVGPLAFKKRDTLQPWGEGVWAEVGDFVRVPRFGGDRWEIETPDLEAQDRLMKRIADVGARLADLERSERPRTSRLEEQISAARSELRQLESHPAAMTPVIFAQFNDHELIGQVTGNPVDMKVYV